jgi:rifampicin phosphotransferase
MSKLEQLERLRALGMPVPRFAGLSYAAYLAGERPVAGLRFPLAVRSSYQFEDGEEGSRAGQYLSCIEVEAEGLEAALADVFASYGDPAGSPLILQEMVAPDYSGVLFAFREGVWKSELTAGQGSALMSGGTTGHSFLLPRFGAGDARLARRWSFWAGPGLGGAELRSALVQLSQLAGRLLKALPAQHGLDIEYAVQGGRLWLLQARPITTPEEAEEVLTSANHKEILPPQPSRLMTAIISQAGPDLFAYYRDLDGSLPPRAFLIEAAGMPWINLSALLDTMVHWGLPTQLVCRSVGAEDFYQVGLRPWRALAKLPVFVKVLAQQLGARRRVRCWLDGARQATAQGQARRAALWATQPEQALADWQQAFSQLYVGLVTTMQILTGAMSGPVGLLERLGLLAKLSAAPGRKSASTDYFRAFQAWQRGQLRREDFLVAFGHRGFYESDLGQRRFYEYTEADWAKLQGEAPAEAPEPSAPPAPAWAFLFAPVLRLVQVREHLRQEAMKLFWLYRQELNAQFPFEPWEQRPEALRAYCRGEALPSTATPPPSGWDLDTFLCNQHGRRLPIGMLSNVAVQAEGRERGIGIYPGKVRGQVWRVASADLDSLRPPPHRPLILVADALDPGWMPYFSQVDGVAAYVGGLLSHASIVLRESRMPSVTQLPPQLELKTGDWVEMDGGTGEVRRVDAPGHEK